MKTKLIIALFSALLLAVIACENAAPKQTEGEEQALTEAEIERYREQGQAIAAATFAALSGQLQQALSEGGVRHALRYCNTVANPLTDSIARAHGAVVKRTSLQVRNPQNQPTAREKAVLEEYDMRLKTGNDLPPIVQINDNEDFVSFYAPIRLVALCEQCHGRVGETLKVEDYAVIQQLYPEDQATGYRADDLRGMWSISLPRSKEGN